MVQCVVSYTAFLVCGLPCCNYINSCSYVKGNVNNSRKPVRYSAVTVTKDSTIKSSRNDFSEADKLFEYMIEPVTPPKFFKLVLFMQYLCSKAVKAL